MDSTESGISVQTESFSCFLCTRDFMRGSLQVGRRGGGQHRESWCWALHPLSLPRSLWVLYFSLVSGPPSTPKGNMLLTNASVSQPKSLLPLTGEGVGLGQGGGPSSGRRLECLSGVGRARCGPNLLTSLQVLGRQIWGAHSLHCLSQHCLLSSSALGRGCSLASALVAVRVGGRGWFCFPPGSS